MKLANPNTGKLTTLILMALWTASCLQKSGPPPPPDDHPYVLHPGKYVPSTGRAVPMDSVEAPVYTPASGAYLETTPPDYVPRRENRTLPGPARYVPGSFNVIPKDSVATPDYVPAQGRKVPADWSRWEPAAPEYQDGRSPFSHLGVEQGLNTGYVFSALEDSRGNIWLGTALGGVSIWDGAGFRQFTKEEGLRSNWVYSLLEDRAGRIWMGTEGGGLSVWDGACFK